MQQLERQSSYSLHYEHLKHTANTRVNTFRNPHGDHVPDHIELAHSTEEEKQRRPKRLQDFQQRNAKQTPAGIAIC